MPRKTSHSIKSFIQLALFTLSGPVLAGQPTPADYIDSKPLLLEVRYCECQATKPDSPPSNLLPKFLDESKILKVGVAAEDNGFIASREFSLGYEISPVDGSSGPFRFNYIGTYATDNGSNTGQGPLVLKEGEWVSLFGSQHQSETGAQHVGVAVRLSAADGS